MFLAQYLQMVLCVTYTTHINNRQTCQWSIWSGIPYPCHPKKEKMNFQKSKRNWNDGYCPVYKGQVKCSGNMPQTWTWRKVLFHCKLPLHVHYVIFFHMMKTVPNLWELMDANKRPILADICNGPHHWSQLGNHLPWMSSCTFINRSKVTKTYVQTVGKKLQSFPLHWAKRSLTGLPTWQNALSYSTSERVSVMTCECFHNTAGCRWSSKFLYSIFKHSP